MEELMIMSRRMMLPSRVPHEYYGRFEIIFVSFDIRTLKSNSWSLWTFPNWKFTGKYEHEHTLWDNHFRSLSPK